MRGAPFDLHPPPPNNRSPGSPGSLWVVGTVPVTQALNGRGGAVSKRGLNNLPRMKPFLPPPPARVVNKGGGGWSPLPAPPPPSVTCHMSQVQVQGSIRQGTTQSRLRRVDQALLSVPLELSLELSVLELSLLLEMVDRESELPCD